MMRWAGFDRRRTLRLRGVLRLGVMLTTVVIAAITVFGQSPYLPSVSMEDRVRGVENNVSVLQARLEDIESVGKGILILVAGQLVISGLNIRRRNARTARAESDD